MARNKEEQIAYLLKRRKSAMSQQDFKKELEVLYDLGCLDERGYHIPTMSIREK